MKKHRIISVVLIIVLIISTTSIGFASTNTANNNRFRYEYETTDPVLVSTTHITQQQATNQAIAADVANHIIGTVVWIGSATSLAIGIASDIYGMNGAGTMYAYSSIRTQYKVHVVTGNRTVAAQWRIATFKLYNSSGGLEQTRTHSIKIGL